MLPVVFYTVSIGENSMDFGFGSSAFVIGVDSVAFFSTSSTFWYGVSRSISMAGSACYPSAPSFVLSSLLLPVLTMLTEMFFFVTLGPTDFILRSDELYFVSDSVDRFSATGTLLRLMIFIYN